MTNSAKALIVAVALLGCLVVTSAAMAGTRAGTFVPPKGKSFHGVSDTGKVADFTSFVDQTQTHSAVNQVFFHWGVPLGTGALQRWKETKTRGVLSLSTAPGGQPEVISPKQIAIGRGDDYMLSLNQVISQSRQVVYIRLLPEMNGHWNPYSAFNADGSARGKSHSTKWFRKAWRRFAIVVKGGSIKSINRRLRKLHMPRLLRARSNRDPVYRRRGVPKILWRPKVALMWVPQTTGSPNLSANMPKQYWPGSKYVDWVGADAYAKFSNSTLWNNLNRFYRDYRGKPFVIGEYGPWDSDPGGAFMKRMFGWSKSHDRTHMLLYYRSVNPTNIFNIGFYPASLDVLRDRIAGREFAPFASEYR